MTEKEVKCAGCGVAMTADSRFCGVCGKALRATEPPAPTEAKCPSCGVPVEPKNKYCHACGAVLTAPTEKTRDGSVSPSTKPEDAKLSVPAPEVVAEERPAPTEGRGESDSVVTDDACGVLRVVSEEHFGREFPVTGEVLRIGKETGADISLPDDTYASHAHARLLVRDSGVEIEDLGSRNGTFIQVRDKERLRNGDRLLIGTTVLEYREPRRRTE